MSIAAYQGVCPTCRYDHSADTLASPIRETADHAELARLAEAASEGPWFLKEGSTPYPESDDADSWAAILTPRGHGVLTLYERYGVKGEDRSDYDDDARFIAAANPATVLALLSEIAALRGERDEQEATKLAAYDRLSVEILDREQAERQRDELRKAADAMMPLLTLIEEGLWEDCPYPDVQAKRIASLRTQIANQGADQCS